MHIACDCLVNSKCATCLRKCQPYTEMPVETKSLLIGFPHIWLVIASFNVSESSKIIQMKDDNRTCIEIDTVEPEACSQFFIWTQSIDGGSYSNWLIFVLKLFRALIVSRLKPKVAKNEIKKKKRSSQHIHCFLRQNVLWLFFWIQFQFVSANRWWTMRCDELNMNLFNLTRWNEAWLHI